MAALPHSRDYSCTSGSGWSGTADLGEALGAELEEMRGRVGALEDPRVCFNVSNGWCGWLLGGGVEQKRVKGMEEPLEREKKGLKGVFKKGFKLWMWRRE
jgi:hypothetical protein